MVLLSSSWPCFQTENNSIGAIKKEESAGAQGNKNKNKGIVQRMFLFM